VEDRTAIDRIARRGLTFALFVVAILLGAYVTLIFATSAVTSALDGYVPGIVVAGVLALGAPLSAILGWRSGDRAAAATRSAGVTIGASIALAMIGVILAGPI
jgi:hypothetical protein